MFVRLLYLYVVFVKSLFIAIHFNAEMFCLCDAQYRIYVVSYQMKIKKFSVSVITKIFPDGRSNKHCVESCRATFLD